MSGLLILTEGRSGSNWLGSLLRSTKKMGNPGEWLDPALLGEKPKSAEAFLKAVIAKGSSENQNFVVKIFPRHLKWVQQEYGIDFIAACREMHSDVKIVRLSRRDRLKQAISYARGQMTGSWTSLNNPAGEARYDYKMFAQAYFYIGRSEAFWDDYLSLLEIECPHYFYEDLVGDAAGFVNKCAELLKVEIPIAVETNLKIQRDELTAVWLEKFKREAASKNLIEHCHGRLPSRTFANLKRFLKKQPLSPF